MKDTRLTNQRRIEEIANDERLTSLNDSDRNSILQTLTSRRNFHFGLWDQVKHFMAFGCFRPKNPLDPTIRKQSLFEKGIELLPKDLDAINLIKSLKTLKVLTKVVLTKQQRFLLKFQKKAVLDSESSGTDSDDNDYDVIRLSKYKKPVAKDYCYNSIKQAVDEVADDSLQDVDKRLLNGIFQLKKKKKALQSVISDKTMSPPTGKTKVFAEQYNEKSRSH